MIFVFGSNLAGRHGKGAAKSAMRRGAIYGQGIGRQGNTYAIPTKDAQLNILSPSRIAVYVADFLTYAREHPELTFQVTKIGCGRRVHGIRNCSNVSERAVELYVT